MDESAKPISSKELTELLRLGAPSDPRDIDPSTLKYAIYARKSTTGDERQERSIPDQIQDCINKVVNADPDHPLKVVGKAIEERQSAKDPGIRTQFNDLLEDVQQGRIDGIIAWHPDRLSRNMKEAGEIIDLLDKGILKDLRFATSTFENSPTGKMLLGISFVLSKQYSEHLSESVTRGNKSKTEAGIFFDEMKHGYVITDDGKLFPNGENFAIIRQAFEKRLEGASNPEIAKWLNTTDYKVRKKDKPPVAYKKWDKDNVGTMFKDPTYAGVLKYGNHYANLEDFYDFTPAVTIEEFFKINKIKDFSSPKLVSSIMANKREYTKANLLRGMVYCGYCNKTFSSSLTSKLLSQGKVFYYFYRCETDDCEFKNKGVRANVVLSEAYKFLEDHLFTTESNYERFVEDAKEYAASESKQLTADIMSITKRVGDKQAEYERTKKTINHNPALSKHYSLDEIEQEMKVLEKQLKDLGARRAAMKQSIMTYKEYLELFKSLSVKLSKTSDMALLDQVLRKFFLNFTVKAPLKDKKQGSIVTYTLKEPWAEFVKTNNFESGRGDRT